MKISALVVLYNCSLEGSETVKSFLNSGVDLAGLDLCVWNNGPGEVPVSDDLISQFSEKGLRLTYIETLQNAPLSWIYNAFIDRFKSDKYVFLDHDSTLSDEYLSYVMAFEPIFLGAPIINSLGEARSPTVNGIYMPGPYSKGQRVVSIGSGIVVGHCAVDSLRKEYGCVFDEDFALYGVDTSFFIRVHNLGCSDKIETAPPFHHSLSRLEKESKAVTNFRIEERLYDLALMLRKYPSMIYLRSFLKMLVRALINNRVKSIVCAFRLFFTRRHSRCSESARREFNKALGVGVQ